MATVLEGGEEHLRELRDKSLDELAADLDPEVNPLGERMRGISSPLQREIYAYLTKNGGEAKRGEIVSELSGDQGRVNYGQALSKMKDRDVVATEPPENSSFPRRELFRTRDSTDYLFHWQEALNSLETPGDVDTDFHSFDDLANILKIDPVELRDELPAGSTKELVEKFPYSRSFLEPAFESYEKYHLIEREREGRGTVTTWSSEGEWMLHELGYLSQKVAEME